MAEKKTSHSQQTPRFEIPTMPQLDVLLEQAGEAERKGFEGMRVAVDESARLMNEALAWQAQMSSEWRRMTLEAVRRTTEMFGQKA